MSSHAIHSSSLHLFHCMSREGRAIDKRNRQRNVAGKWQPREQKPRKPAWSHSAAKHPICWTSTLMITATTIRPVFLSLGNDLKILVI